MPTYEYECRHCGHAFEAFQSMTDKPLRKCPECGGRVRRLIGAGAGVIFKGAGFYATDYRSTSYAESAKADKPKKNSKTEAKPGQACLAKADGVGEADRVGEAGGAGEAGKAGKCRGGSCGAS